MMRRIVATLLLCFGCGALAAQNPASTSTESLEHGNLTIWFIAPPPPAPAPQPYTQYHEQTAGTFGRAASTVGRDASDVGTTAGNFPATAAAASRPASEIGQTAGSFGTAASNIGQTAGSYGQPASTLGAPATPQAEPTVTWVSASSTQINVAWRSVFGLLQHSFPQQHLRIAYVGFQDLGARLHALERTRDYPDLLVGTPVLRRAQTPFLRQATFADLGPAAWDPTSVFGLRGPQPAESLILFHAPHPAEARAFIVWLSDLASGVLGPHPILASAAQPAAMARSAVATLLAGGAPGPADPVFAQPSPRLAQITAFRPPSAAALESLSLRTDVFSAAANQRFAVVALRTIAQSAGGFGVVHPFAVLRTGDDGNWRILQISTDLDGSAFRETLNLLDPYARDVPPALMKPVLAITQASPIDNDVRSGPVDLWWDNPGLGTMLAVEWQSGVHGEWSDSHLFLVPDTGPRPRVRVTAPFPLGSGFYRWRVWTLGTGGVIAISPWRHLTQLQ